MRTRRWSLATVLSLTLVAGGGTLASAAPPGLVLSPLPLLPLTGSPAPLVETGLLPDLTGDGVPEVSVTTDAGSYTSSASETSTVVLDGRSGTVLVRSKLASTPLPVRVGPHRVPGVVLTGDVLPDHGGPLVPTVAAYALGGGQVWRKTLPGLTAPTGTPTTGQTALVVASLDARGSTDLAVEGALTIGSGGTARHELRVDVLDAVDGATHRLVDDGDGGVAARVVPLGGDRDGLLVDHRDSAGHDSLRAVDGAGRQLWSHRLPAGTQLSDALPLTVPGATEASELADGISRFSDQSFGLGATGASADLLVAEDRPDPHLTYPTAADSTVTYLDARSGAIHWTRPGLLAGTLAAGGGRGAAAVTATQQGRTVTLTAIERSGATRWRGGVYTLSDRQEFPVTVGTSQLAGSPVPDLAVEAIFDGGLGAATAVLDGANGKALHPLGFRTGQLSAPPATSGEAELGVSAPGGTIAALTATRDDRPGAGGLTTFSRRDVGATRDRWSVTLGSRGEEALAVGGMRGPRGCGSAAVLVEGQRGTTLRVYGLTGGQLRYSVQLSSDRVTRGPRSAKAC